ncbi:outer membrane protein assembly factor BamE [Salinisphaera sp.]|uniref:outer membrane protein assembly factor BamE n=1 Tax=Salinisphaera sp. TaxID=1914330 RepID=UPI002D768CDD|nr:outer membrane protein assembly factor BamE [Salinisphaera sp.]HET7314350.1 outer membrane protein assembly factor BamE [Salinisphaera sp.]
MKPLAALMLLLALSACSLPVFFRVPIVQGNIVTTDQVAKLKKGMTKKQVAYVLGTPLIKSPFETDRWDYVFYYRNPYAHVRESQLNLYFTDGKLTDIEGDEEYMAQAFKAGNQPGPGDTAPLPGGTSAIGAPLGTMNSSSADQALGNAAENNTSANDENLPGSNRTVTTETRPTIEDPLPHKGPPLPGQPD